MGSEMNLLSEPLEKVEGRTLCGDPQAGPYSSLPAYSVLPTASKSRSESGESMLLFLTLFGAFSRS